MNRFCQHSLTPLRRFQLQVRGADGIGGPSSSSSPFSLNQTSSLFTKSIKDKHGKRVTRRIIRPTAIQPKSKTQPKLKRSQAWPKLPKIVTPQNILPKPIQPPPSLKPLITPGAAPKTRRKLMQWLKDNAGIIVLNCGSIASFLSFTRTDILDLRLLSITGSLSSVIYFASRPPPLVLGPVIWSSVFALTNAYMVYYIYEERKGKPKQLTAEEYDVYEEHFLPHAVTPRQFEKMMMIGKKKQLKRGDVLVQKGESMENIWLVVDGATEAVNNLSRRVTVASSAKGNKEKFAGGDAGAWVGELHFLSYLSDRDRQGGSSLKPPPPPLNVLATAAATGESESSQGAVTTPLKNSEQPVPVPGSKASMTKICILTYIATEDSTLYEWDNKELADLMQTSADLRSALTRTMTAAVMGKVVNVYISQADANEPMWKKWISDNWPSSAPISASHHENISGVRVNIARE